MRTLSLILVAACASAPVRADPPKPDAATEKAAEKLAAETVKKTEAKPPPTPPPPPPPQAQPAPEYIECYNAACDWVAKPGEPLEATAKCVPGYVSETIPVVVSRTKQATFCICCPSVRRKAP